MDIKKARFNYIKQIFGASDLHRIHYENAQKIYEHALQKYTDRKRKRHPIAEVRFAESAFIFEIGNFLATIDYYSSLTSPAVLSNADIDFSSEKIRMKAVNVLHQYLRGIASLENLGFDLGTGMLRNALVDSKVTMPLKIYAFFNVAGIAPYMYRSDLQYFICPGKLADAPIKILLFFLRNITKQFLHTQHPEQFLLEIFYFCRSLLDGRSRSVKDIAHDLQKLKSHQFESIRTKMSKSKLNGSNYPGVFENYYEIPVSNAIKKDREPLLFDFQKYIKLEIHRVFGDDSKISERAAQKKIKELQEIIDAVVTDVALHQSGDQLKTLTKRRKVS